MKNLALASLAIAAAASAFAPSASAAALLGANVSEEYRFPELGTAYPLVTYSPQSFTVGAGQESSVDIEGVTTLNVDFSDLALGIAFDTVLSDPEWSSTAFNGLVFTSSAFANLTGVTINGATNLTGFDASRVSLVGNELRLNWSGIEYDDDSVVALDFTAGVVPEPSTWALMIFGIGLAGAGLRRKRAARPAAGPV